MPNKSFGLAVRAVIKDEQDRCLLIRRSSACRSAVGKWEWPGGKVDPGETFDAALIREVREETGLDVRLKGLVGAYDMDLEKVIAVVLCLEAVVSGGTVALSEEHDSFAWAPVQDMFKWDISIPLRGVAEAYIAQVKSK